MVFTHNRLPHKPLFEPSGATISRLFLHVGEVLVDVSDSVACQLAEH